MGRYLWGQDWGRALRGYLCEGKKLSGLRLMKAKTMLESSRQKGETDATVGLENLHFVEFGKTYPLNFGRTSTFWLRVWT